MTHGHHSHSAEVSARKMGGAVLLTLAFGTCETIAGHFAHSLALLSDAGTVGSDLIASSCHVLVEEQSASDCEAVLKSVTHELEHRHGINHSTIQVEVEGCEAEHALCSQQPEGRAGAAH